MADQTLTRAEEQALAAARTRVGGTKQQPARSASPRRRTSGGRRPKAATRSLTLDTARGLAIGTVLVLVLVGDPQLLPRIVRPAGWHGFGLADLLPALITTLVGVSMAYQLAAHRTAAGGWWALRLARRVVVLVAAGATLAWAAAPVDPLESLRLTGPLTRIALGGVLAWIIVRRLDIRGQAVTVGVLLIGHWVLLARTGLGAAGWTGLDARLLAGHALSPIDPDGLASLAPTVAAIVAGVWIGVWLRGRSAGPATVTALALAGIYTVAAGVGWAQVLPVNAQLWTAPTVLLGAGAALLLLAASHLLVEVLPLPRPAAWLTATGALALPVWIVGMAAADAMGAGQPDSAWASIHEGLAAPLLGPLPGAVAIGVAVVLGLGRAARAATLRGWYLRA